MAKNQLIVTLASIAALAAVGAGLAPVPESVRVEHTKVSESNTESTVEECTESPPVSTYRYRGHIMGSGGTILWYTAGDERVANEDYNECFANLISSVSAIKLDTKVEKHLRSENPTVVFAEDGFHKLGSSLMLTVDEILQKQMFELLKEEEIKGSITILDEDGAIRAAASYPSFDHNAYQVNQVDTMTEKDAFNHQTFENHPVGSIFKILSGVVSARYGILARLDIGRSEHFKYQNWDYGKSNRYPCRATLQQAILNSSNTWFGETFYELGATKVEATLNQYFSYGTSIESDFGVMTQEITLDTNADLVRSAFGQRMSCSPIYMAAAGNAIVSDSGEFCVPYVTEYSADTATLQKIERLGKKIVLSEVPKEFTEEVTKGMQLVADDLSLYCKEGYTIFTKTGTAEINHSGYTDFLYILTVVKDDETGRCRTAVLQIQNPKEKCYTYASNAAPVMNEILELMMK